MHQQTFWFWQLHFYDNLAVRTWDSCCHLEKKKKKRWVSWVRPSVSRRSKTSEWGFGSSKTGRTKPEVWRCKTRRHDHDCYVSAVTLASHPFELSLGSVSLPMLRREWEKTLLGLVSIIIILELLNQIESSCLLLIDRSIGTETSENWNSANLIIDFKFSFGWWRGLSERKRFFIVNQIISSVF